MRSAIRRTFSTSPSRSIAGNAHSSPMASGVTSWNAVVKAPMFSASRLPSEWEMRPIARSYTRG